MRLHAWIAACLVWLVATEALASGFAVPAIGPSNGGVSAFGPTSVHFNPAAIGHDSRIRLLVGGDLLVGALRYQRERRAAYQYADSLDFSLPIDPSQIDVSKTGEAAAVSANPIGVLPSAFIEGHVVGPLSLGGGLYVPYAALVKWPKDGAQRFQLVEATIADIYASAGFSLRFGKFAFGAGGSAIVGYANLSKVQDVAAVPLMGDVLQSDPINQRNDFGADADPAVRELDTLARPFALKNAFGGGWALRAGLLGEPLKDFFLSASGEWASQMRMQGDFSLDMNDPFFTEDLASQGFAYPAQVKGDGELTYNLPWIVRAGLRYDFGDDMGGEPRSSLALEGQYTGWSRVENFRVEVQSRGLRLVKPGCTMENAPECELVAGKMKMNLPRRWLDTYGATLRAAHHVSRALLVWVTLSYETGASPDATIDAASPDGTRITGGGGLTQQLPKGFDITLDFLLQQVLERRVVASDYDLGNGTYQMRLFSMGLFASYRF
jgi:long-chain fatty acid transport protein